MDLETRDCLKVFCLEEGLDKKVAVALRKSFYEYDDSEVKGLIATYGYEAYKVGKGLCCSRWKRNKRIEKRIASIVLSGEALFITLNFKPSYMGKTNEQTRRKQVARYLKANFSTYVANIDYGEKNGREHYHAVGYPLNGMVDYKSWHKFGCVKAERVKTRDKDCKRIARYITKLTRHAIKKTAGQTQRIIYSRNIDYLPPAFLFE